MNVTPSMETSAEFRARMLTFWMTEAALNREAGDEALAARCDDHAATWNTPYGNGAIWEAS